MPNVQDEATKAWHWAETHTALTVGLLCIVAALGLGYFHNYPAGIMGVAAAWGWLRLSGVTKGLKL